LPTFLAGSSLVSVVPPNKRLSQAKKPPELSVFAAAWLDLLGAGLVDSAFGKDAGAGASGNTPLMTGV
jgi:hypothetical protein